MRSVLVVLVISLFMMPATSFGAVPAFPGAEGFGRWAKGGRWGDVYIVDNLNNSGTGSLRKAINASGPRTVVFEVSGTIYLNSALWIWNPFITIAGQTAPGDGICLANHPLNIGARHVIVRYIRSRLGDNDGAEADCIGVPQGNNIIIDHCSASWGVDECLSVSDDADNVTVQWCIISEGLRNSIHSKGAHSYGTLVRGHHGAGVSYHHNIFAHNEGRNPRPGNYISHTEDPEGFLFDFRNNVVYNWGGSSAGANYDTDSISKYNFIKNYYKAGANSTGNRALLQTEDAYCRAYFAGNYMNGSLPGDPWSLVTGQKGGAYRRANPLAVEFVTTETAPAAYTSILAGAGASHARDSVDSRIINDIVNGTGRIIDDEDEVGGWPTLNSTTPPTDTDRDGMPDSWETARGLNPNDASDRNGDRLGDGYSNLEEYINYRAGTASAVPIPGTIEAEDYNPGGEGVAYHDTTAGNTGGEYRTDDVDIGACSEGGFNIGWTKAGEWLAYDVNVAITGTYKVTARVATIYNGRRFHLDVDGVDITGPVTFDSTGNWQTWADVEVSGVNLNKGAQELRVVFDTQWINLNYITIQRDTDINGSGKVDWHDFAFLGLQWGFTEMGLSADFDNSLKVDALDVKVFTGEWLKTTGSGR